MQKADLDSIQMLVRDDPKRLPLEHYQYEAEQVRHPNAIVEVEMWLKRVVKANDVTGRQDHDMFLRYAFVTRDTHCSTCVCTFY